MRKGDVRKDTIWMSEEEDKALKHIMAKIGVNPKQGRAKAWRWALARAIEMESIALALGDVAKANQEILDQIKQDNKKTQEALRQLYFKEGDSYGMGQ